jgi:hypothetical protein
MLWHCDGITGVESSKVVSKDIFEVSTKKTDEHIFTWTYARGTIVSGKVKGKWLPPGPSSTNGPLLSPHVMKYFLSIAEKILGDAEVGVNQLSRLDCCGGKLSN